MESWLSFFGLLTNVFIIFVVHLVYEANISNPVILNESQFLLGIVLYSLLMVIWIVLLFKKFNKTNSIADVGMRIADWANANKRVCDHAEVVISEASSSSLLLFTTISKWNALRFG